jgi:post-segregation antitoxin (ccd killing protein)
MVTSKKKGAPEDSSTTKLITVKIDERLYNRVKAHKKDTYMPISVFVEEAIEEKLKRLKK